MPQSILEESTKRSFRASASVATTRIVAFSALLLTTACAHGEMGKSSSAGSTPAPMVYPTGVMTTSEALPMTSGIYAVPAAGGEACCWVDHDVRFVIPVPQAARSLHVDVTVPMLPSFAGKKQVVTELDNAGKSIASRTVRIGLAQSLTFPLPPARTYGLVLPVHLRMSAWVVPHDVGAGPDVRRLALILSDAYAR